MSELSISAGDDAVTSIVERLNDIPDWLTLQVMSMLGLGILIKLGKRLLKSPCLRLRIL